MNRNLFGLILGFIGLLTVTANAQKIDIPMGTWRAHPSFYNQTHLLATPTAIYAASEASLFRIEKGNLSITPITKTNGLSEVNITALAYHPQTKNVIIGYTSGSIDILKPTGEIVNISAIKRFNLLGSKTINHIFSAGSDAYLSCDFGLVILNVVKEEVKNSNIGLSGSNSTLVVNSSTIINDTLYLATAEGLKEAPLNSNLKDGASYKTYGLAAGAPTAINDNYSPISLVNFKNTLYIHYRNNSGGFLYKKTGNRVTDAQLPYLTGKISKLSAGADSLMALMNNSIITMGQDFAPKVLNDTSFYFLQSAEQEQDGRIWISDFTKTPGYWENGRLNTLQFDTPIMKTALRMHPFGNKIAFASGGYNTSIYTKSGTSAGYSVLGDDGWQNFNFERLLKPFFEDCVHVTTNASGNKLYGSLWGGGLLVADIDNNGKTTKYELWDDKFPANSTLNLFSSDKAACRITSSVIDLKNQLFIGNFTLSTSQPSIHKYSFSDKSFVEIQSPDNNADSYECPLDIIVADNNDKWIRIAPNRTNPASIWVVSDQGIQRGLNTAANNGNLPSETVNDIAKDIDGSIWVGTNIGVAVFYSPSSATRSTTQAVNAITPIFEGRPLLEEEQITAIAIDGGGRKWFGTKRNGIYLYDKDISRSILFFNTENSPLPSNNIIDIAINKVTGEVFIATDLGIVSYRSHATDPAADGSEVVVFPNPVRPNFNGLLGIRGLPTNSQVKITDIAGRKVFEGNSDGGGISWNLKDYNNRRAKTGIYLVFASNEEGTETLVGKFAVVE
jgi:hypothetical protein